VLDALLAHRSVRAFLPDPVDEDQLAAIIAAASSAATSSNLQTWSVVAVRDPARKQRLSVLCNNQKHIAEAPLFLVFLADLARLEAIAAEHGEQVEGLDYLEMLLIGIVDATLAAQNAVVALESLGLGSVYIGGIRNHPERVAGELGLPPRVFPVFGLCVGTPDPARPASIKPRLPQPSVLHHEQYNPAQAAASIAAYDARMSAFQAEQGMTDEIWTRRSIARVRSAASLTNRHRMRAALANLGFALR
jgi:nitroreductase